MNFTCDNCQKRYSIADEKVRGKTVKVRCKNCQTVITVEGPAAEESTRVVSLADVERIRAQERSLADAPAAAPAPEPAPAPAARAPVSAPQTPWDDEPTRAAPVRQAAGSPWFVMVRNKQEGPLDEAALAEWVSSGTISARSFFWRQGMPDWKRGSDIPELAAFFAPPPEPVAPPPPPPVMAPPPPAPPARAAPARREPEPQAFMPEPEPEAPASSSEEEEDPPDNTYFGEPAPRAQPHASSRRQQAAPREEEQASAAPLNELFSDLDLPGNRGDAEQEQYEAPRVDDPRALGADDENAPVEDTRYFMKKSGVTRRNPAWKIALFVVLLIVVPVGILYALSVTRVMPLTVKRVDAAGQTVEQPVFSAEGVGALRDKLLGRTPPVAPTPPPAGNKRPAATAKPEAAAPADAPGGEAAAAAGGAADPELAAVYADSQKQGVNPEVRKDAEVAASDSASAGGPPEEEVQRVVAQTQPAFRNCIEQELRKNPSFRGGKVTLTATVGASGSVKGAAFDRTDVNGSSMGACIKDRAKRMVFPSFSGEDVELQIPLVLSGTM